MSKQDRVAKPLKEAIKEVTAGAKGNFDETVEVHFNLNTDVTQADQMLRATTTLPHGTGKEIKVAVMASTKIAEADLELTESDLVKLEKGDISPKKDFDVLIVEPAFMGKIAKLGPILGPAGVMPNPKTGTVTDKVSDAVKAYKKGKITIRNEITAPIVHLIIGKISFKETQLEENFMEIWGTLKSNKPQKAKPNWIENCFITSSMGKSSMVDINIL